MDNVESEISKKVKSAVQAKLLELGVYVDDELPDYVMVLAANKKTKEQMDEDLSLFLGQNTSRFTLWLHTVLEKLNAVSEQNLQLSKKAPSEQYEVKEEPPKLTPSTPTDKKKKKKLKKEKKLEKLKKRVKESEDLNLAACDGAMQSQSADDLTEHDFYGPNICLSEENSFSDMQLPVTGDHFSIKRTISSGRAPLSEAVVAKTKTEAAEWSPEASEENGQEVFRSEIFNPADKPSNLSIKIDLPRRNRRTIARQPIKSLILRAVADANKSVSLPRKRTRADSPSHTPIVTMEPAFKKMAVQAPPQPAQQICSSPVQEDAVDHQPVTRPVAISDVKASKDISFIVTLDGIHKKPAAPPADPMPKASSPAPQEMDYFEEVEEWEEEEVKKEDSVAAEQNIELVVQGSIKKEEACRFWPDCKEGDNCLYSHNAAMCKSFPNCRYGEKCMFGHPLCKFNSTCNKPDCPFRHTVQKMPGLVDQTRANCRFYPNCRDVHCLYKHPKICRFGKFCQNAKCGFNHPVAVGRSSLRWVAPKIPCSTTDSI